MSTAERIKLNFPIEHDGVPINEIALRRPTVGDHLAARVTSNDSCGRRLPKLASARSSNTT